MTKIQFKQSREEVQFWVLDTSLILCHLKAKSDKCVKATHIQLNPQTIFSLISLHVHQTIINEKYMEVNSGEYCNTKTFEVL
jgi:hypothetical protein